MSHEPSTIEICLTLGIGGLIAPFYRSYVNSLPLQEDEKVLDFGSGSGVLSRHIAARLERGGGQLTCVDISARWMKVIQSTLRSFNNVSRRLGHITWVDLPDASFDTVLIHFVLHDIPAAERPLIMQTLVRKLKPGGRLILREPQGHGLDFSELEALIATEFVSQDFEAHQVWLGPVYDGIFYKADLLQTGSPEIRHSSDVIYGNKIYTSDHS